MVIRVVNWLLAPLQVVWTHKLGLPKPLLEWVDLPFHWLVPASGVLHPGVLRVISSELRVVLVQSTYCTKTPRFGCPHTWRKMVRVYTQSWKVLSPHIFSIPYLLILNLTGIQSIQYTVQPPGSAHQSWLFAVGKQVCTSLAMARNSLWLASHNVHNQDAGPKEESLDLNTTSAQSRYQVHWLNFSKWNQKAALHPACRAVANAQAAVASDRNPAPGTPGTLQQVKHSSHLLFQWIPPNNPSKTSGISWLTSPGVLVESVKKTHHCEENIFCGLTSYYQVTRPETPSGN